MLQLRDIKGLCLALYQVFVNYYVKLNGNQTRLCGTLENSGSFLPILLYFVCQNNEKLRFNYFFFANLFKLFLLSLMLTIFQVFLQWFNMIDRQIFYQEQQLSLLNGKYTLYNNLLEG